MRIWKYPLEIKPVQTLEIPAFAKIIHAGLDPQGVPCIWAQVHRNESKEYRQVCITPTGGDVLSGFDEHLGSFVQGEFMWHVFI